LTSLLYSFYSILVWSPWDCFIDGLMRIGRGDQTPALHRAKAMARPQGLFLILEINDIKEIVAKAVELLKQGKTMMEYSDSGTSVVKGFPMTIQEVLVEARYALMVKDPEQYGSPDRVRVMNLLNNFRGL